MTKNHRIMGLFHYTDEEVGRAALAGRRARREIYEASVDFGAPIDPDTFDRAEKAGFLAALAALEKEHGTEP